MSQPISGPRPFSRAVCLALVLMVLWSMLGCGAVRDLGFGDQEEEFLDQEEAIQMLGRDHDPDWVYEHGMADTTEKAREQALSLLARRVATHVRAETQRVIQETTDNGTHVEEEMKSTTATLAHVSLEGTEVTGSKRVQNGWVVEMGMSRANLNAARRDARERAPLLARFEALEALPQDSIIQRLELALQGYHEAREKDLHEDPLYVPDEDIATTFGIYFEQEIALALNRMQVLPVRTQEDEGELVIIDSRSYAPQKDVPIILGGQEYRTSDQGKIGPLDPQKFEEQTDVVLDQSRFDMEELHIPELGQDDFLLDTIHPGDWQSTDTQLYIHTQPSGHGVLINEQQKEITPTSIRVDQPEGEVHVWETEQFAEKTVPYSVAPESSAAYVDIQLSERSFAQVLFHVEGDGKIKFDGPQSFSIEERYEGTLEAGNYDLTILHQDHEAQEADYQILEDEVTLYEGQRLERTYQEPRYRDPYHRGSGWSLSIFNIGSHRSNYPLREEEDKTKSEVTSEEDIDIKSFHLDIAADYRSFTDSYGPWMYQFGGGWRMSFYEDESTLGDDWESFHTVYGRAGVGFWTELSNYPIWIGPGYTYEHVSPPEDWDSFNHDYAYMEAGMLWGSLEIIARIPFSDEGFGPYVGFGFSFADIEKGYERPATQSAQEGVHYEQKIGR